MRPSAMAWIALRWLFGAFFFTTGVAIALHVVLGVGQAPVQHTAAAADLDNALHRSGIVDPLLAISYLVGGAALIARRTTPLGLVLLGPAVVVISVFDTFLAGYVPVGLAVAAIWGLLVLRHFPAFTGLWTYGVGDHPPIAVAKAAAPR